MEEEANLSLSAVTEDTVDAFEDLCLNSLNHPDMPKPHMESVIRNLNFEMLFNLGTEVIDMSAESDGAVMDFHEQR
jgi:hypothetical protein